MYFNFKGVSVRSPLPVLVQVGRHDGKVEGRPGVEGRERRGEGHEPLRWRLVTHLHGCRRSGRRSRDREQGSDEFGIETDIRLCCANDQVIIAILLYIRRHSLQDS